jgi:hypothetical protein
MTDGGSVVWEALISLLVNEDAAPRIRVRFELAVEGPTDFDLLSPLLLEASQIATIQKARRTNYLKPIFRLVEVNLDRACDYFDSQCLLYVAEITACDVRVSKIGLACMEYDDDDVALEIAASVNRILVAPTIHGHVPVDSVHVEFGASPETLVHGFSSVLYSTTVREVIVAVTSDHEDDQDNAPDHVRLMEWLAWSVFGPFGCPSLDKVTLCASELRNDDIRTFERTLRLADASSALFGTTKRSSGEVISVTRTSKFVLTRPVEPAPAGYPFFCFGVPLENLPTVTSESQWVSVILPGWGQAWIRREDAAVEQLSQGVSAWSTSPRRIRQLTFLRVDNEEHLLDLLRLVGDNITVLTIQWMQDRCPSSDAWIRTVCRACPGLQTVQLERINLTAVNALVDCYADGVCNAARLVLDVFDEGEWELFHRLGQDNSRMTRHVRELIFTVQTPLLPTQLLDLLMTASKMLERNRLLWLLDMTVRSTVADADDAQGQRLYKLDEMLARFDGAIVAVQVAPLRLEDKLAFLSVLQSSQQPCSSCGAHMDTAQVGTIFDFAAECKKRRVVVTIQ